MKLNQLNEALLRLGESVYRDLDPNFNINDIDNELKIRYNKYKELTNLKHEIEDHYIYRFDLDLALLKKMFNEQFKEIDFSSEDSVKNFFNDVDFRLKHAEGYVGLPG